jgi:pantoate--beta-alanine ligase
MVLNTHHDCIFYYLEIQEEFNMSLIVITNREEMIEFIREQKLKNKQIGFVPTMGALHRGHINLIKQCVLQNEICVVSIFVNPKQFGANEDLAKYPRQFQQDRKLCEEQGVQVLFSPSPEEIYPAGFSTEVSVQHLTEVLCGKFRPGHFKGVTTVVLLLLNILQPDYLYLGQKDFQQVQVIKKMCDDLAISTHIVVVPTIREKDGLALSSRNTYLTADSRKKAMLIPKALASAGKLFLDGERSCEKILDSAIQILKTQDLIPQYLELRLVKDLSKQVCSRVSDECILAIAQLIESNNFQLRLIDNIILSEDSKWLTVLEEFIQCPS